MPQPVDLASRSAVAATCAADLEVLFPVVVDDLDDSASRAYGAWPDRMVVLDAEGRITYFGAPGPFGFLPDEVEAVLRELP